MEKRIPSTCCSTTNNSFDEIGTTHDLDEFESRRVIHLVLVEKRIEAATLTVASKLDVGCAVGDRADLTRRFHLVAFARSSILPARALVPA